MEEMAVVVVVEMDQVFAEDFITCRVLFFKFSGSLVGIGEDGGPAVHPINERV